MFQKNSGMEETYAEGGDITFSVETFFLTVPKNFVGAIVQGFRNMRAWKNFMRKKEISLFSVGTFFSHIAEKFRRRN